MSALSDIELYEFLGLEKFASEKEIKKAYRKLALKLHPDKNPENNTVEKFKKLAIVYEILTNIEKKEEYDQKLRAKEQAKKRNRERNAHAQELKRQFDEREKAYQERKKEEERKKKEKEDERRRLLEEERRRLHEEALELERKSKRFCTNEDESEGFKVRVSWKASKKDKEPAYTTEEVTEIFSQYGQILFVVKSPVKEGRYMIVFADKESAILSSTVGGKPSHPLTVKLSFDVGKMPLASKMMQERPDPQVSSFEDLLKRYGIDQKVPSDFGKAPEKSEPKLEEFDERTGLPVKYVYAHGTDTIFACAATFSLPPEIRLRGDEEVEYGGYIVRLWPNERDKYVGLDD